MLCYILIDGARLNHLADAGKKQFYLTGNDFVKELDERNREVLERLGQLSGAGHAPDDLTVERLLRALRSNYSKG